MTILILLIPATSDICSTYHSHKGMHYLNDLVLTGIASMDRCWYLCVTHTAFVCNSAEYVFSGDDEDTCRFSTSTSYTHSGSFRSYDTTNLKERCTLR